LIVQGGFIFLYSLAPYYSTAYNAFCYAIFDITQSAISALSDLTLTLQKEEDMGDALSVLF
jgi:hypothetical protein